MLCRLPVTYQCINRKLVRSWGFVVVLAYLYFHHCWQQCPSEWPFYCNLVTVYWSFNNSFHGFQFYECDTKHLPENHLCFFFINIITILGCCKVNLASSFKVEVNYFDINISFFSRLLPSHQSSLRMSLILHFFLSLSLFNFLFYMQQVFLIFVSNPNVRSVMGQKERCSFSWPC